MNSSQPTRAIDVVYCYSDNDQDRDLKDELEKHLMAMQREGIITTWHEDKIGAGQEWQGEIDKRIDTARIILPLISPDFVSSDKSYKLELGRSIERHRSLEAYSIPIILRPVDWQHIKFDDITLGDMSVLPDHGLAVTRWNNYDEAFVNIAQNIRQLIRKIWKRDELGIDDAYNQLKQELSAQEWQKANETTKYLIFKIANQEQTGSLSQGSIKKIPSRDIRVINNLWVENSHGHFGFSVQEKILIQNNYQDFLTQIGWFVNDSWLKQDELNFTLNAPQGHLPYCGNFFWEAEPSPAAPLLETSYYRIPPLYPHQQYRIPVNYYRWREEQQRQFREQFSIENKLKQRLNFEYPIGLPRNPVTPVSPGSGAGIGQAIAGIVAIASKALPWAIVITAVAGGIYAGVKIYDHIQKEKEKEKKENEIKENINALFSHLDSWTI